MAENYGFLPFFIENAVCDGYTSSTDFVGPPSPRSHPKTRSAFSGTPQGKAIHNLSRYVTDMRLYSIVFFTERDKPFPYMVLIQI